MHPDEREFSYGSEESSLFGISVVCEADRTCDYDVGFFIEQAIYVHESFKALFDEIGTNVLTNILK